MAGRWALTREPWRFTIDYLHVGTVDARIAPSSSSSEPLKLPQDLRLPMQLDIRDVQVDKLLLHQGASTTEFSRFALPWTQRRAPSRGRVERLDTPFGAVTASAKLDGVRPFPLTGDVGYSGKVNDEAVQVGGASERLARKSRRRTRRERHEARRPARSRGDAVRRRAAETRHVTVDHVNPQAFARARRWPIWPCARKCSRLSRTSRGALVVTGPVSIVNAKPGAIDKKLLPLIDANADVRLDAPAQRISNLNVRLVKNATITGGGTLTGKRGQFDLKVAKLDLNALASDGAAHAVLRPDRHRARRRHAERHARSGRSESGDARAGQGDARPRKRRSLNDVKLDQSAQGRIDLSGALKHDANSSYNLKATAHRFRSADAAARQQLPRRKSRAARSKGAKPRAGAAPPRVEIEARVNGTLTAAGMLAPDSHDQGRIQARRRASTTTCR